VCICFVFYRWLLLFRNLRIFVHSPLANRQTLEEGAQILAKQAAMAAVSTGNRRSLLQYTRKAGCQGCPYGSQHTALLSRLNLRQPVHCITVKAESTAASTLHLFYSQALAVVTTALSLFASIMHLMCLKCMLSWPLFLRFTVVMHLLYLQIRPWSLCCFC
jgi:hypothetical protein